METRLVPDAPGAWLVYDLGTLVLAVPPEFRAAADAVAAMPRAGLSAVLVALRSSGIDEAAPFAVLDAADDGLHLALRGPATLAAGAETFTGLGAEPWLERVIPTVTVVRLTVPGGEWTLTIPSPSPGESVGVLVEEPPHVTAVPDLETSLSPPPTLGIGRTDDARPDDARPDDGTLVVDEIARLRARRAAGLTALPVAAAPSPAPTLSLELPDGSREPLDAVVFVGRAPSLPTGAPAGRLVRLDGDSDISRNHARVAVEGGTVVVTDLGSRNGTIVRIPGRPAQKLRQGEPTPVLVGTVIDFGGGLELNVRED